MKTYLVLSNVGMRRLPRFHVKALNYSDAILEARKLANDIAKAMRLNGVVNVDTFYLKGF